MPALQNLYVKKSATAVPHSVIVGLLVLCFSGCANWYGNVDNALPIATVKPGLKTPDGHIALQTIFLRLEEKDRLAMNEMWPQLDEVSIDFNLRRELDKNGIRCGTINGELPMMMQRWVDRATSNLENDPLESAGLAADVASYSQLFYCKSGTPKDLSVKPMRSGSMVVMHSDNGGKGRTFIDPALHFKLRGDLLESGGIKLSIGPAIEHGQYKSTVTGQDFALRREFKRDVQQWPNLAIERDLRAGQILVLSSTAVPRALGENFFMTETSDGSKRQLVLLIRIDKKPIDMAFAP